MPSMFPISAAALPSIPTRKALVVLDLQRDFVCADGALPVTEPEGFVSRTLELVKAFRDSGAGEVIWVRTEFERNRPLSPEDDDRIIVSDLPIRRTPANVRRPSSRSGDHALERDPEAFLTSSTISKGPPCVRKGTSGADFAPEVQDAVVAGRDIVFTKTDYSVFASGQQQLVQKLRGRFVTKMYLCGALTNVSIYATALDAGMHGYEMTLVEDCCGFRNELRHLNAVKQLVDITGCATMNSPEIIESLQPPKSHPASKPSTPEKEGEQSVQDRAKDVSIKPASTGLSPVMSHMKLGPSRSSETTTSASPPKITSTSSPAPHRDSTPTLKPRTPSGNTPKPGIEQDAQKSGGSTLTPTPLESRASDMSIEPDSAEENSDSPEDSERLKALLASVASKRAARSRISAASPTPRTKFEDSTPKPPRLPQQRQSSRSPGTKLPGAQRPETGNPGAKPETPSSRTTPTEAVPRPPLMKDKSSNLDQGSAKSEAEPPSSPKPSAMIQTTTPTASEAMCAGDTTIIANVLPPALADDAFERLLSEVSWATMSHLGGEVPRRIAVQGAVDADGSMPVYRHPADESPPLLPFSPTVLAIKNVIETHLGHPLNHVLIQHYRSGNDYISEHSDKTLDVAPNSFIANLSLGAERTMLFRTKRPPKDAQPPGPAREIQRAPLPHNSLCRMGLQTNMRWLHAIRQDKRADRDKSPAELAHHGARISLTFRRIGTFLNESQTLIWGQGATSKTRDGARPVVNGQTPDAVRMLQAFGAENNSSEFDWAAHYGAGFDVLHMGTPKRFCAGTGDAVANRCVAIALAELGLGCAKGSVEGEPRFEDNDPARTTVEGAATVLRYLDAVYGAGRRYDQMLAGEVGRRFGLLQGALDLARVWKDRVGEFGDDKAVLALLVRKHVRQWEGHAKKAAEGRKTDEAADAAVYIAGGTQASPADFALWPVLHDMVHECGGSVLDVDGKEGHLKAYYKVFGGRGSVKKVLGLLPQETPDGKEAKTE